MSRLIDADKLKEAIEEEKDDNDYMCRLCLESIKEIIDEQPAAFDVDKVVEQLEEVEKAMTSPVTEDCFGEECRASDCTVCLISKAIEIVKGGGVEREKFFLRQSGLIMENGWEDFISACRMMMEDIYIILLYHLVLVWRKALRLITFKYK